MARAGCYNLFLVRELTKTMFSTFENAKRYKNHSDTHYNLIQKKVLKHKTHKIILNTKITVYEQLIQQ